jgi:hypothetical protein
VSLPLFLQLFLRNPNLLQETNLEPYIGNNGAVEIDQLNTRLTNIGHKEDCLSFDEQKKVLKAAGCSSWPIPITKLSEFMD